LIKASPDPLAATSPDGKIIDVNEAIVKVIGVFRKNRIGTDFSSYFTGPENSREGYRFVFSISRVTDYPLTIRYSNSAFQIIFFPDRIKKFCKFPVVFYHLFMNI